jgi:hypothetical protein
VRRRLQQQRGRRGRQARARGLVVESRCTGL